MIVERPSECAFMRNSNIFKPVVYSLKVQDIEDSSGHERAPTVLRKAEKVLQLCLRSIAEIGD